MQQFIFNGHDFFEMARKGDLKNIEVTAKFDDVEKLVQFPITFKTEAAWLSSHVNVHSRFNINLQIKTTQANGIIAYSEGTEDFICIELVNGHVRYVYNVGSGVRVVRSTLSSPVNDNKWHDVGILRPALHQHILRVDGSATFDNLPDSGSVHFDTDSVLYIGGMKNAHAYTGLPEQVRSRTGFQGCMASFDLNGDSRHMLERDSHLPPQHHDSIVEGCQGNGTFYLIFVFFFSKNLFSPL